MKNIMIGGLSVLLLSAATAPAVIAQTPRESAIRLDRASPSTHQTNPFNLVSLAYRGHFEDQGIPGYIQFATAYKMGDISAKDIVRSGIETGRISPDTLEDRGYLNAVRLHADSLVRTR